VGKIMKPKICGGILQIILKNYPKMPILKNAGESHLSIVFRIKK